MKKIRQRERVRSLKLPAGGTDFTSNDYLGLSRSPILRSKIDLAYASLEPKRNGSTGSRLLSGNHQLITDTESMLARLFRSESCLLFDSGYHANLAVLSTLPQAGDTIIMDELSHASLKDGARLSLATKWNFAHNNLDDLRKKLTIARGDKWVVVESIYSMDGDYCPLRDIIAACREYGAHILLDEAHSTGIHGTGGNGLANELGVAEEVDIRVYTFGKAMGVHGACVACSEEVKDLLVNFSRPFIYTTAPSDHSIVSISSAFSFLGDHPELPGLLRERISWFRDRLDGLASWNRSASQIQVVLVPGQQEARNAAALLQSSGYDVRPILSPTVKEGTERLRICLHTYNTETEIQGLTDLLKSMWT